MEEKRLHTGFWYRKTEGKKPLGKHRQRRQYIKMSYRTRVDVDWINLRTGTSGRHLQTQ